MLTSRKRYERKKLKPKATRNKRIFKPIRNQDDIERIRLNLRDKPRDLLLFNLSVQTGTGMKKLLRLKVKHLLDVPGGGEITAFEGTPDEFSCPMTVEAHEAFNRYIEKFHLKPDEYLFKSNKGSQPLNLSSVSNMVKGWFAAAELDGYYGAISLRKTWEYHQRNRLNADNGATKSSVKNLFTPIRTPSIQTVVYKELLNAIISGKIPPGSRLTTAEIAKSFAVSDAPVRVAMNWLEAKGFIEGRKKKGSTVKKLSPEEQLEITKVRTILETAAAEISFKAFTEETLHLLEAIVDRYRNATSFEETDQLNRKFHQTLYRDANMPLLVSLITDLYDRFCPYAAFAYQLNGRIPDHDANQKPEYYQEKILESLRRKNLGDLLKYLKMKLARGTLITEEIMKEVEGHKE